MLQCNIKKQNKIKKTLFCFLSLAVFYRRNVDSSDVYIRDKMEFYDQITTPLIRMLILETSSTTSPGLWQ